MNLLLILVSLVFLSSESNATMTESFKELIPIHCNDTKNDPSSWSQASHFQNKGIEYKVCLEWDKGSDISQISINLNQLNSEQNTVLNKIGPITLNLIRQKVSQNAFALFTTDGNSIFKIAQDNEPLCGNTSQVDCQISLSFKDNQLAAELVLNKQTEASDTDISIDLLSGNLIKAARRFPYQQEGLVRLYKLHRTEYVDGVIEFMNKYRHRNTGLVVRSAIAISNKFDENEANYIKNEIKNFFASGLLKRTITCYEHGMSLKGKAVSKSADSEIDILKLFKNFIYGYASTEAQGYNAFLIYIEADETEFKANTQNIGSTYFNRLAKFSIEKPTSQNQNFSYLLINKDFVKKIVEGQIEFKHFQFDLASRIGSLLLEERGLMRGFGADQDQVEIYENCIRSEFFIQKDSQIFKSRNVQPGFQIKDEDSNDSFLKRRPFDK